MDQKISQLQQYIAEANQITFFGGAGVSTESGLPDYRSSTGRYKELERKGIDPKVLMSKRFMLNHPEIFFRRPDKESAPKKPEPNAAHYYLAKLEEARKDIRIVTQNVDGLHQRAGSRFVLELHGSDHYWYCMDCERKYQRAELTRDEEGIPRCPIDRGIIRPAVILFGENPDPSVIQKSKDTIAQSDLLIIAGTSLSVYPAKNLTHYFKGKHVVVINEEAIPTPKLTIDLFIQAPVGQTLSRLPNPLDTFI
ncbi:NAD-dependent protein deacylase [Lacticigenium naphthae]|uniref:NAD-dependent protein deacylase n=1 Tax=Lacticigenium naphthae TaxID=515351 RepID=UPI0003F6371F|nr:NAD-dependent protein deacylase [Lacticigenium naphthae]